MRPLLPLLLVVLTACNSPAEPSDVWQDQLNDARARWEERGPNGYVLRYTRQCFCPPFSVEVEVREGRVTSVRDIAADSLFTAPLPDLSIPQLFVEIQEFIDRGPHALTASYDSLTGMPLQFSVDPQEQSIDEEFGMVISAFRPLP